MSEITIVLMAIKKASFGTTFVIFQSIKTRKLFVALKTGSSMNKCHGLSKTTINRDRPSNDPTDN